jgi:transposase
LLKVEPALRLFVRVEGIEPTNNAAERALRPAVIWRRTSLGTQSALGSQFVARMLTIMLTLRAQQRPVLEYLTAACQAARHGLPAPSLLPNLSLLEQEQHFAIAA